MRFARSTQRCRFPRSIHHAPRRPQRGGRVCIPCKDWRRLPIADASLAPPSQDRPPTPRSIHDIDNGATVGYGFDLAQDHPGFHDATYKQRRRRISQIAKTHIIGEPIPRVEYTEEEKHTWRTAFENLKDLYPLYACREFNAAFEKFGFSGDVVPQLEDISRVIQKETGWQLRPVSGVMQPRGFLNGLAYRTFHCIQFVRYHSQPMYSTEPDLVHELLGHVALLADPQFSQLMQIIGIASLGASKQLLQHLSKVYYYTVEFGAVREGDQIKAIGAGILSSYGELQWFGEGHAQILPFNPYIPLPKMVHREGFQKCYFALDSFEDGYQLLKDYVKSLNSNHQSNELSRC